jgi:class 3 adenylate cyclase
MGAPYAISAQSLLPDIEMASARFSQLADDERTRTLTGRPGSGTVVQLLIDAAGDGVFASFDGPARAIRCTCAIRNRSMALGTPVRAGLHTGECEVIEGKIAGIAVHIGARVAGQAQAGEVVVSSTVKDLVAGSGLRFSDGTVHTLKGVPGEWRLFRVA